MDDLVIISFAWTTPALLAGAKTVTRRGWKPEHAAKFTVGSVVDAWDKSPRTGKGRHVARIRITRDPWRQRTDLMTTVDYAREGFDWLNAHGEGGMVDSIAREWSLRPVTLYVVEFELVEVLP